MSRWHWATNVTSEGSVVTGLSTSNNNKIDGYISVGGTTGTNGQYLISTGQVFNGLPSSSKRGVHILRSRRTNNFLVWVSYTPGLLMFLLMVSNFLLNQRRNTKRIHPDDGSSIVLTTPAVKDAIIEIIAYGTSSVGVGTTATRIAGVTIQEDSTQIGPTGTIKTLNFVGASVSTFNALGLQLP